MALPQTAIETASLVSVTQPAVRRCTFRRLSRIGLDADSGYEVSCLYPDRRMPLPLGDFETSLQICGPCAATHIFRPDED